jgi:hypothetical protein
VDVDSNGFVKLLAIACVDGLDFHDEVAFHQRWWRGADRDRAACRVDMDASDTGLDQWAEGELNIGIVG